MSTRSYRWLARYYDELFTPFRAPLDAARNRILGPILPRVTRGCDLACGTGITAMLLARAGIKTYAVDLSPIMCQIARRKAKRARLPVRVLRGDMRTFRLPEAVDLITCEYDALNHVPHKADLPRVANAVARALRPGGYFYFDLNNSLGFTRYWTGTVWFENPRIAVIMRNGHSRRADRAWSEIDLFVREGNCWRRHRERVEEVCWNSAEIKRVLQHAGFDRLRTWDAAPFWKNPLVVPGCRTIYLARKFSPS